MSLIAELKRRELFKLDLAYRVVAWLAARWQPESSGRNRQ